MKMFIWDQEFLRDYSSGIGVAVAETVEEARDLILESCKVYDEEILGIDFSNLDYECTYSRHYQAQIDLVAPPDKILDLPAAVHKFGGA